MTYNDDNFIFSDKVSILVLGKLMPVLVRGRSAVATYRTVVRIRRALINYYSYLIAVFVRSYRIIAVFTLNTWH